MDSVEVVLAMVLAVVASGYLVRVPPFSLPLPLAQIALGALIAEVFRHSDALDPGIFFLLFLPPLLFRARHDAAIAAIAAIEKAQQARVHQSAETEVYIHAAAYVLALYRHRLEGNATCPSEAVQLHATEEAERALRLTALQAERDKIFSLARQSQISNQISRKLVREIDLFESRYR